ncbi:MAG: MlaD family protein [Gammaproteobacteria bacterium]|nr:MlaD family protein [Gammaproteobacteria bacterium]
MKKDNINYAMVGLFVFTSMLLLFGMLYQITGQQSGAENYTVVFNKITGIKDGAAVTYGGYQIGQVDSVVPITENSKTRYHLSLNIKGGWQIPDDSVAQIVMPGIVSEKQIEISEGYSTTRLKPGDTIRSDESVDVMNLVNSMGKELENFMPKMMSDMSSLLGSLKQSAGQMNALLSDDNRQHVENMFRNADQASANLVRLASGFDRVNQQLEDILQHSQAIVTDNDEDIRYTVTELRRAMDVISENIHGVMYNIDASSRNINEFSRQLRNNPGVILGGKPPVDQAEVQ